MYFSLGLFLIFPKYESSYCFMGAKVLRLDPVKNENAVTQAYLPHGKSPQRLNAAQSGPIWHT
jgi:hypothetical protein